MFNEIIEPAADTCSDNDPRKAALFAAGVLLDACGGNTKLAIAANALCGKLLPMLDGGAIPSTSDE